MPLNRPHSRLAREAAQILGARVAQERKMRRWTRAQLAERVGVSPNTLAKVERGDLSVGLGVAFEAAALLGVELFDADPLQRARERVRISTHLALLPQRVRALAPPDDDF